MRTYSLLGRRGARGPRRTGGGNAGCPEDQPHRGDLPGELELRQPVRQVPGANGLDNAGATAPQVDKDGKPYATLPQPLNTSFSPAGARSALPGRPAGRAVRHREVRRAEPATPATWSTATTRSSTRSTAARWTSSSPGAMPPGLVMSYYDATNMPEGKLAQQFTHARQLLPRRVRRLVPQPPFADLRLRADAGPTRRRPSSRSSTPTAS